jgi:tRNA threonylcarbamoyladenosine biosynthesis protein TsaE
LGFIFKKFKISHFWLWVFLLAVSQPLCTRLIQGKASPLAILIWFAGIAFGLQYVISREVGATRNFRLETAAESAQNPPFMSVASRKKGTVTIRSLRELRAFAKKFASTLRGGEVIALSGPLGAGKTTFVQYLGQALGVAERITSPTFTLMHVHAAPRSGSAKRRIKLLVHLDAYRLGGPRALAAIGALDYLARPDTVAVVEWAEKVRRELPPSARWLDIVPDKNFKTRTIAW